MPQLGQNGAPLLMAAARAVVSNGGASSIVLCFSRLLYSRSLSSHFATSTLRAIFARSRDSNEPGRISLPSTYFPDMLWVSASVNNHRRSPEDRLIERAPGRIGDTSGMTYFQPNRCIQLRSRAISVPGTTLGLYATTPIVGISRAK